jgi:hypothetical protein
MDKVEAVLYRPQIQLPAQLATRDLPVAHDLNNKMQKPKGASFQ